MSDFQPRSFDAFLPRAAPSRLVGNSLTGDNVSRDFDRLTLIAAVKEHCDGCRAFIEDDLVELKHVDVVVACRAATDPDEWRNATSRVIIAPELLEALEMNAPPTYVLIDPRRGEVILEGVLFSPTQVAAEIAPFLVS